MLMKPNEHPGKERFYENREHSAYRTRRHDPRFLLAFFAHVHFFKTELKPLLYTFTAENQNGLSVSLTFASGTTSVSFNKD